MNTGPGGPLTPVAGRHRIQPEIRTATSGETSRNLDSVYGTCESYLLSLRALELAVERVKETCKGDDIEALNPNMKICP